MNPNQPVYVNLQYFKYDKDAKTLSAVSEITAGTFPVELRVLSHITGRIVVFVQDQEAAERNEFWDGEMMEYVPITQDRQNCKAERLILTHQW